MRIYIPTLGRVDEQATLVRFEAAGVDARLVCSAEEAPLHIERGRKVLVCPAKGISATRQFIMDHNPSGKVAMFDDDLRFGVRRLDNRNKFYQAEPHQVVDILDRLERMLDQVPMVGLAARGGANNTPDKDIPIAMNKRMFDVHCFDAAWFHKEKIRYRTPLMEDFDVVLQGLTKGFPNALLTSHTKDNVELANAPGGCSLWRTMEQQEKAARWLVRQWPAFVRLREVNARVPGEWATRVDVTVQWVQAFKAGQLINDWPTPDWSDISPEWDVL